jgi:Lrp/AsnC family transcriptional regulator, leucine-responsive regulatory protein
MAYESKVVMDHTNWHILRLLQENARMSLSDIGESVGLTAPAVGERIRRLEDAGIISGYHAQIDLKRVGRLNHAFIRIICTNGYQSEQIREVAKTMPEVVECYCITGEDSYILKVVYGTVQHLENVITCFKDYGQVITSIVLSTHVTRRVYDAALVEAASEG